MTLTIDKLIEEAKIFCEKESTYKNKELYGVTDGKAVGTAIEHKFKEHLSRKYDVLIGSSANGIDMPSDDINTDIKVTSINQPQSSSPFRDARQKIYGLGYNLLLMVYDKKDNPKTSSAILQFMSCAFIYKHRTADYTLTKIIRQMIENDANKEDIISYLMERNLPADEITLNNLADEILSNKPEQGYLTISNALQWRLQYGRIVRMETEVDGIIRIINNV